MTLPIKRQIELGRKHLYSMLPFKGESNGSLEQRRLRFIVEDFIHEWGGCCLAVSRNGDNRIVGMMRAKLANDAELILEQLQFMDNLEDAEMKEMAHAMKHS